MLLFGVVMMMDIYVLCPFSYNSSTVRRSTTSTDSTVPRIGGASIVFGVNVTVCELLCTES